MSADLGAVTYTAVTWTAGDVITEAKLDIMVANDQAYDSHSAQGLLLNNEKALAGKDSTGTAQNIVKINSSNEVVGGYNQVGWVEAGETWVFGAIDAPSFTFTVAGVDLTDKYSAGMRVKYTNDGSVKFGIITKVVFSTNTTVTIYGGTDYALVDSAITLPYYSTQKAPQGFPLDPIKWTVVVDMASGGPQNTPTPDTWYNLAATHQIEVPIGAWKLSAHGRLGGTIGTAADMRFQMTISTANNSETDGGATVGMSLNDCKELWSIVENRPYYVTIATKDIYYINVRFRGTAATNIYFQSTGGSKDIRAVCAYL